MAAEVGAMLISYAEYGALVKGMLYDGVGDGS